VKEGKQGGERNSNMHAWKTAKVEICIFALRRGTICVRCSGISLYPYLPQL